MKYPIRYFKRQHVLGLDRETGDNVIEDRHYFEVGAVEIDVTHVPKRQWRSLVQAVKEVKQ